MIDRDFVKKISEKYQTTRFNILREYTQNLFLWQLYLQKGSDNMLFKGGTALRLIYNSPRFSEDLDFTSVKISKLAIEDMIQDALVEIERFGIHVRVDEFSITSGGYICFISMNVLEETLAIELNILKRISGALKGEATFISNDFVPPYNLIQLPQRELVNEKIKALLERAKPRDFFDLYFMMRSNLLATEQKGSLYKALVKLKSKDYNFTKELKIFLPRSHQAIIKNFKQTLQREIDKMI